MWVDLNMCLKVRYGMILLCFDVAHSLISKFPHIYAVSVHCSYKLEDTFKSVPLYQWLSCKPPPSTKKNSFCIWFVRSVYFTDFIFFCLGKTKSYHISSLSHSIYVFWRTTIPLPFSAQVKQLFFSSLILNKLQLNFLFISYIEEIPTRFRFDLFICFKYSPFSTCSEPPTPPTTPTIYYR